MAIFLHIRRCALLLALLAAALPIAHPATAQQRGVTIELKAREDRNAPVVERVSLYPRSYALVIGNDDYRDPYWVKLSNGVRDAREVAAALEAKGFEVTLAENLDGDALEEALEAFFFERGQDFEARLFVWYAGHGHTEAGEGYLVPVDAPDPDESASFRRTALSLRRMGEYARGANAHHVLAVFDSCFAGTVFEVQRTAPPAAITRATTRPVRQFITSGDAGQTVSDDGTFRRMFIEAIGGERRADLNADGYVTASELGLFLADRITNYSNGTQTPRYGKLRDPNWDQGDFVFALGVSRPSQTPTPSTAAPLEACLVAWQTVANSPHLGEIEAFLWTYPTCSVAPIARARLAALSGEARNAESQATDSPDLAVEERDETLFALKNANVRAAPETGGAKLATLSQGSQVTVTGKVQDRDWLRVALRDGETGYIWSPLLGDKPTVPPKEPETKVAVGTYPERRTPAGPRPAESFRDCAECPEMVVLPAGSFMMGSTDQEHRRAVAAGAKPESLKNETPQHRVTIPAPFAVGKYEVTWAEWEACVRAGACDASGPHSEGGDEGWGRGRRPAINVSWNDAKVYVAWLSRRTGQNYRLLSEAEWEYAARAGTTTSFHTGNRITPDHANFMGTYSFNGSAKGIFRRKTEPVGSFAANAFGLHDMHGNVWEWVEDCYSGSYAGAPTDGSAKTAGGCQSRVRRGGSWLNKPGFLRSALRVGSSPVDRNYVVGFRVARTLSR